MRKDKDIVRYTAKEVEAVRKHGGDRSDSGRITSMTDAELDAASAEEGNFDWGSAEIGIPQAKQQLTVRLDRDVVDWFKAQGAGYQTRMNAVLRSFVNARRKAG